DGFLDGPLIVRLHVDRAGGADAVALEALLERVEVGQQRAAVVGEAEAAPVGERLVVRKLDVQRDVLEALLAKARDELAEELVAAAFPSCLRLEVDETDVPEAVAFVSLGHADDLAFLLG